MGLGQVYGLSGGDVKVLRELIRRSRERNYGTDNRPSEDALSIVDNHASTTHVAKTPTDGIPGIDESNPPPKLSKAFCDIYRVRLTDDKLVPVSGLKEWVYNFSKDLIPGDSYVFISKDKYENWITVAGGGASVAMVKLVSTQPVSGKGYYDAVVLKLDGEDQTYTEEKPCWFWEINGNTMIGQDLIFLSLLVDGDIDGRPLYTSNDTVGITKADVKFIVCCDGNQLKERKLSWLNGVTTDIKPIEFHDFECDPD